MRYLFSFLVLLSAATACAQPSVVIPQALPPLQITGGTHSINLVTSPTYSAYGDSITSGGGATDAFHTFEYLLSTDCSSMVSNHGFGGDMSPDMTAKVFSNENPGNSVAPFYTAMIGTNDALSKGNGAYEAVYTLTHQAALSWLAISSTYKTFATAYSSTTGTWVADNTYQSGIGMQSTTNGSTLVLPITTTGKPIYVWYRVIDGNGGTFVYSLDGAAAISVSCSTSPAMATTNGGTASVGFLRISPVTSGSHSITFSVTSATNTGNVVGIIGIGTPSSVPTYNSPSVFSGGVLKESGTNGVEINATATAAYNTDAQNDANLLANDGLRVYFVNVRNYINLPADYNLLNLPHPNNSGHAHIRDAFEYVMQPAPASGIISNQATSNTFCFPAGNLTLTGTQNLGLGQLCLSAISSGCQDTGIGFASLGSLTGGSANTACGTNSLNKNTLGCFNCAFGNSAMLFNTAGSSSCAFGNNASEHGTSASYCSAFGASALFYNTGTYNTAVGYSSLVACTSGNFNTACGCCTLLASTTGAEDTAFGGYALANTTTGSYLTALGWQAGRYVQNSGTNNVNSLNSTYLGANTYPAADGDTNETVIGYNAVGLGSNTIQLGNNAVLTVGTSGALALSNSQTTINGTGTSANGSMVCSMPFQGASYKKVVIYCNALAGSTTPAYTYPNSVTFSHTPKVTQDTLTGLTVTATTTSVTIQGTTQGTGWVFVEGF